MSQHLPSFPDTNADWFQQITNTLSPDQLLWLSGYSYGLAVAKKPQPLADGLAVASQPTPESISTTAQHLPTAQHLLNAAPLTHNTPPSDASALPLTILYGSHTGNSKKIALRAAEHARKNGLKPLLHDMSEYPLKNLKQERNLLVVVSTHGEGEPPIAAEDVYAHLHSPRAPKLHETSFSVLALGDKSYLHFCKTGADFDAQLENLGAKRLVPRVDCDVDFEDSAEAWIEASVSALLEKSGAAKNSTNGHTKHLYSTAANDSAQQTTPYSKKNPFPAPLLEKIQLNGRGSEKETFHLEFSLEDAGLVYEAGDSLGVVAENSPRLVEEVLEAAQLSSTATLGEALGETTLAEILSRNVELTLLTRETLTKHNEYAQSSELTAILADTDRLKSYLYGHDVADLLRAFPAQHTPETLTAILRKLPPRLYSIASSLKEHENEVHLTVGAVRYEVGGRRKEGLASCFLADRVGVEGEVKVFVERNEAFKLPQSAATDIIMVGPGTGIAPFRAFVEDRANDGASGKNWLFFGNPHFTTDFLYQTEWQQWLKKGVLTKLNVAFSRDQAEKLYVQHKLLANSKEIFAWLENGASFYVCGDKNRMAHDVEAALKLIVQQESGTSPEKAAEYVKSLKKQRRYLEDVY
ncbi:MAG: assimilatory sulfite reductase (NADPH) flavoprotein subunit [Ignavibacteria bacterium]|nr:assimilatory sulfite reductase (NADPH) flavoprotein subunit [Ignavibacteria bacterium]